MRVHGDWSTAGFDLPPSAPMVGPFVDRDFLQTWWRHRGEGELLLVEDDDALLPLWRDGATVSFLGEEDLTDYHAPRGAPGELVAEFASGLDRHDRLLLDSLPTEAADVVEEGLAAAGLTVSRTEHEVAAVLDLPATYDDYLGALAKKQRHEVRRKRRRFEEALGEASLVREPERFGEFVSMHRAAPGAKGGFMTPEMEELFADLLLLPGAVLDVLVAGGVTVAAAFGFEGDRAYYLYNSAFSPDASSSSPGVVLIDLLVGAAIAAGRRRFDFLKGDETYKFRLGASRRPLWRLEVGR